MRLLHTTELKLYSFFADIPKYAILSHTWQPSGECTLQDLQSDSSHLNSIPGYDKVQKFCTLARYAGFEYAWVDTCCIDKTSSAELQEAINSMYRYYKESQLCVVYLADVMETESYDEASDFEDALRKSKWFTRGWTLQELLAPKTVEFWSNTWKDMVGTKGELANFISQITGISSLALNMFRPEDYYAVNILHWASHRQCTRKEDEAYSLLGLLGVNMPLLYGEGDKAFVRLQQEILSTSDDESLLAWESEAGQTSLTMKLFSRTCLYAPSVAFYRLPYRQDSYEDDIRTRVYCENSWCGKAFTSPTAMKTHQKKCWVSLVQRPRPFTMSSQGLIVRRKLWTYQEPSEEGQKQNKVNYFVVLNVSRDWTADNQLLLPVQPLRRESFYTFWLNKDVLNFGLCDRSRMCSKHDLDARYSAETVDEFELLILKEVPRERR